MARGYRFGVVGSISTVPDGSTVLPTDDIQIWLKCASIKGKTYTTLSQVLADSTTLQTLITSPNAVDYMVRSTTWASGVTADSGAMTLIGANNYASNTLRGNSTWLNAICNSTYFESVLNAKVPTMTSATAPSGEVISSAVDSGLRNYYAFNGNLTTDGQRWSSTPQGGYIGYHFTSPVRINLIEVKNRNGGSNIRAFKNFELQGSNDGTNWTKIAEFENDVTTASTIWKVNTINSTDYEYYRLYITSAYDSTTWTNAQEVQFYGRVDV